MRFSRRNLLKVGGVVAGAAALGVSAHRVGATVSGPGNGVSWPAGDALPTFAVPQHFDVADLTKIDGDTQAMLTTLQGIVNRVQPRLYWYLSTDGSDQAWLKTSGVPYTLASDPWSLLAKYRGEVRGVVIYDPDVPDSVNVATILAGIEGAVIASPPVAAKLTAAPFGLSVIHDFRGAFTSKLDAYSWALANLWPRCTHRALASIEQQHAVSQREEGDIDPNLEP